MSDVLRVAIIVACGFSIGTMIALYERVGRFILPRLTVRLLVLGTGLFIVSAAVELAVRNGSAWDWRTGLDGIAATIYVLALARLWHWFGSPQGRAKRHAIVGEYYADELHRMAEIARALEADPEHMGRYAEPSLWSRLFSRKD